MSPPGMTATATVSGTAYTVCPVDRISFVAPDSVVTVTPNSKLPVVVPTVTELNVTTRAALS